MAAKKKVKSKKNIVNEVAEQMKAVSDALGGKPSKKLVVAAKKYNARKAGEPVNVDGFNLEKWLVDFNAGLDKQLINLSRRFSADLEKLNRQILAVAKKLKDDPRFKKLEELANQLNELEGQVGSLEEAVTAPTQLRMDELIGPATCNPNKYDPKAPLTLNEEGFKAAVGGDVRTLPAVESKQVTLDEAIANSPKAAENEASWTGALKSVADSQSNDDTTGEG